MSAATALRTARAALARTARFPARPKLALLGDSRNQLAHQTTTGPTTTFINVFGPAFHITMQTGGRVDIPQRLNFAVGGIGSADMISKTFAYIAANTAPSGLSLYQGNQPQPVANTPGLTPLEACAQSDADIVVLTIGTNDRTLALTLQQSKDNVTAALTRLRQAGKIVILLTDMPRGDPVNTGPRFSGQNLKWHLAYAQWVRNLRVPGVFIADPWQALALASSASGDALAGTLYDGLHPGFTGCYLYAKLIAQIINTIVPPVNILPTSNTDVWSTDNPAGALNNNPTLTTLTATPGAASGVTITGNLPLSWPHNPRNMSGVTIAYGSVVLNGITYLSVTLSGTPTVASPRLDVYSTIGATQLAAIATGDVIQTSGIGYVQAGSSGFAQLSLHQNFFVTGNGSYVDIQYTGNNNSTPTGSVETTVPGGATEQWGGPFVTDTYTHAGAGLGSGSEVAWRIAMTQNVAVNATFLLGPTATRKVLA